MLCINKGCLVDSIWCKVYDWDNDCVGFGCLFVWFLVYIFWEKKFVGILIIFFSGYYWDNLKVG